MNRQEMAGNWMSGDNGMNVGSGVVGAGGATAGVIYWPKVNSKLPVLEVHLATINKSTSKSLLEQ